jgi:hypothetical protein
MKFSKKLMVGVNNGMPVLSHKIKNPVPSRKEIDFQLFWTIKMM